MSSEQFDKVLTRYLNRRGFLAVAAAGVAAFSVHGEERQPPRGFRAVTPVPANTPNAGLAVAEGHQAQVLLRWGDPLTSSAPAFDPHKQTPEAQRQQFGYNCDFVGFIPFFDSHTRGLLIVNHEYNNPELMFPQWDRSQPTAAQVAVMQETLGLSVVELRRDDGGKWAPVLNSPFNRRISTTTPMAITGPAADHPWVGKEALGTMNNCSAGKTPWGTVLSGEENFQDAFAFAGKLPESDPRRIIHLKQYTLSEKAPKYDAGWWRYHDRFDVSKKPNEPFKFGWVVEVDPWDSKSVPKKRTALGRIKHEACTYAKGRGNQAVLYTGDDEKFQCVYKFVSKGAVGEDRHANSSLLDDGTLYVARFNDDGTGEWLPLVQGQGPLTVANGFKNQADVLVETRRAAQLVGGTLMDRPEDIETNPKTGRVYIALTNNKDRKEGDTNPANPRGPNKYGHVVELTEAAGDHAATRFEWNLFLLAGPPKNPGISCPDNVCFDPDGELWISTDGAPKTIDVNDGLFMVQLEGAERGVPRQFLTAPTASEVCGPEFTPDGTTLFVALQHPGESEDDKNPSTFEKPLSRWPDQSPHLPPRPSVVAITRVGGGRVGHP